MKIEGVDHIALNVRNLKRAEDFYTKVLGFEVFMRLETGAPHIMVRVGPSAVALFEAPDLDTTKEIDKLSEDWLAARGN